MIPQTGQYMQYQGGLKERGGGNRFQRSNLIGREFIFFLKRQLVFFVWQLGALYSSAGQKVCVVQPFRTNVLEIQCLHKLACHQK